MTLEIEVLQRLAPAPCSDTVRNAIERACQEQNIRPLTLPSGAGHDGMQLTDLCPIGMIFVRSKNGISHNPDEWSTREDCTAGAETLYRTILELAQAKPPRS